MSPDPYNTLVLAAQVEVGVGLIADTDNETLLAWEAEDMQWRRRRVAHNN